MGTRWIIRFIGVFVVILGLWNFALKFFGGPPIQIPGDILSILAIIGGLRLLRLEESGRQLISLLSLANVLLVGLLLVLGIFFPKVRAGEIAGRHIESQPLFWGLLVTGFVIFGLLFVYLRRANVKAACR